jgi:PAS domain S-box-containing protein
MGNKRNSSHHGVDQRLKMAEERFQVFFDEAPIGKCMTSPDGRLLRVNQAFGEMLGYSLEEIRDINFAEITHPDDLAISKECVRCLPGRSHLNPLDFDDPA